MATPRTKESLQRMFEETRLRQEKRKQDRKKQSLQRLKEIYRHQDQSIKEALEARKKQLVDNLSTLLKQTQQRQKEEQIQPSFKFKVYHSDFYVERDTNEEDLYQSIDELKQWEQENYHCINWDAWDRLVEETKVMLNQQI